jgi:hypothetical protein
MLLFSSAPWFTPHRMITTSVVGWSDAHRHAISRAAIDHLISSRMTHAAPDSDDIEQTFTIGGVNLLTPDPVAATL